MAAPGRWPWTSRVLIVLWIAFLGADRVDFLGGEGPFALTPFLVLSPFVVGVEAFRLARSRSPLCINRPAPFYLLALLLLLAVILLSALRAPDLLLAAKRASLLTYLSIATFLVAAVVIGREGGKELFVTGAKVGLAVAVAFSVGELSAYLSGMSEPVRVGFLSLNLVPHMYYDIVPRLSGSVFDANRGGFLALFFLFVIVRWGTRSPAQVVWSLTAVALILLSLSRSTLLATVVTLGFAWLESRRFRVRREPLALAMILVAILTGWVLVDSGFRAWSIRSVEPLALRFSPRELSAREHVYILERGVQEATQSVSRAALGLGYGNSYLALQDVFPGSKYGNFHSLYVSMLAEAGLAALLLSVVLLFYPLFAPGPFRPLVAGVTVYNLFYQSNAEPWFWLILALAWLTVYSISTSSTPPLAKEI